MIASARVQRSAADTPRPEPRVFDPKPFLSTHRALGACAREFALLAGDLVRGAVALHADGVAEKPVVCQSPDRCIVQLGPVAVSVAWLRGGVDPVADGELLVIVWRGTVAPLRDICPERAPVRRAPSRATPLWQETLTPTAMGDTSWYWRRQEPEPAEYSSAELAARFLERLRLAHAQWRAVRQPVVDQAVVARIA